MVTDPGLAKKIDDAAPRPEAPAAGATAAASNDDETMMDDVAIRKGPRAARVAKAGKGRKKMGGDPIRPPRDLHPPTPLEQVVGVILGSPEFQRR
jgi:hypothetical protein